MISIAACDGEPSFAFTLKRSLCEWEHERGLDLEYLEVKDSDDLVELCNERGHMDLVFLALHPQKGPDGVAAARGLKKADDNLNIVPVTADKMIDVEFVRLQPSGILILPFESHEVKAIADSCVKRRRELFIISSSRSRIAIPIDQICYINKKPHPDFRVVEIHCTNGRTYQSYMTTQEVEKQLAASGSFFLRIRNSCFVNPFFVHSVSSSHVRLIEGCCSGESRLIFGRGYGKNAVRAFSDYMERKNDCRGIARYT